jgi:hypothetical protein
MVYSKPRRQIATHGLGAEDSEARRDNLNNSTTEDTEEHLENRTLLAADQRGYTLIKKAKLIFCVSKGCAGVDAPTTAGLETSATSARLSPQRSSGLTCD